MNYFVAILDGSDKIKTSPFSDRVRQLDSSNGSEALLNGPRFVALPHLLCTDSDNSHGELEIGFDKHISIQDRLSLPYKLPMVTTRASYYHCICKIPSVTVRTSFLLPHLLPNPKQLHNPIALPLFPKSMIPLPHARRALTLLRMQKSILHFSHP